MISQRRASCGQLTRLPHLASEHKFPYRSVLTSPTRSTRMRARPQKFRDFLLLPLLCYDLSDPQQPYLLKPRQRHLFTTWKFEHDQRPSQQYVFPRGCWRSPLESEDHYAMAALILLPVTGRKGYYKRAGIAEFGSLETIWNLQQACRQTLLPPELHVEVAGACHAYKISVV